MSSTDSNSSNSPLSPSSSTPTNADAEASGTKTNTDPQTKSVSQDLRAGALDSNDLEGLDAKKLTKFYRVPNARFKTPEDIIKYYGYELKEKIAEGGFGVIYKAVHIKTKVEVACKQMDMTKGKCEFSNFKQLKLLLTKTAHSKLAVQSRLVTKTDDSKMTDMKNELYILQKMAKDSNPFIVKLYIHFVVSLVIFFVSSTFSHFSSSGQQSHVPVHQACKCRQLCQVRQRQGRSHGKGSWLLFQSDSSWS